MPWLLAPALATMLVPFLWMLFLSLQPGAGGQLDASHADAREFTLAHYRDLLSAGAFPRYLLNSIVVAWRSCCGNVLTGAMVGYALARKRFPGNRALTWGVIATLMVPKQVLMIPLYLVLAKLRLARHLRGADPAVLRRRVLDLPHAPVRASSCRPSSRTPRASTAPRSCASSPRSCCRCCGRRWRWSRSTRFLLNWNSFLFPLIFTNSDALRTLPVGLALFAQGEHAVDWGLLMAGSTISALPMLAVFLIFQRQIIEGITAGAEKG